METSFFKYRVSDWLLTEDDEDNLQYTDNTWFDQAEVKKTFGAKQYDINIKENIRGFERDL